MRNGSGEEGFVLVEALVALAIFAMSATAIYQIGQTMLGRSDAELDRSAAQSELATMAQVLQARGAEALGLLDVRDDAFRYDASDPKIDASLTEAGMTFSWLTLRATNPQSGAEIASLAIGYEG